ncbi:MAG: helix-turn-helix transcriptional regulator [Clostridia bacterium]|nr:helix-turn-helix transcriptional regulator [Clostridia bacterium]
MKELKDVIAENLLNLRQAKKFTQLEIAEKLNYTDKSVSKWEHGDVTPPVEVLKALADIYGVSLDYIVTENPEGIIVDTKPEKREFSNKIWITLLAVSLVWLIAVIFFVYAMTLQGVTLWQIFVSAVPVSCIVLLVFNGIWGKRAYTFIIITVLVWSILTTFFVWMIKYVVWPIFILGIPLQIAIILWAMMKPRNKR